MYTDEDRQSALTRALITAGAAMTQPGRGGLIGALGRGGMMGMQAYDQTYDDIAKRRIQEEQQRQLALKAKLEEIGLTRQEALAKIFSQFSGDAASGGMPAQSAPRPSVVDAPGWAGSSANAYSPNAAPSIRPQQQDAGGRQEALIRALDAGGFQNEAKAQLEIFKGLEGEVYGDPQVDRNGRTFVNTKRGPRYLDGGGFVPRDKLVETDVGDRKVFRTEYDLTPRGEYRKGMSPDAAAANALGWANYSKPQLYEPGGGAAPILWGPDAKSGGIRVTQTDLPGKQEKPGTEYTKQLSGVTNLRSAIGDYRDMLSGWSLKGNFDPDARAKMGTYYNNMMLQAKEAYNLGVLNGPDYTILTSIVTDPTSWKGAVVSNKTLDSQAKALDMLARKIAEGAAEANRQPVPNTAPKGLNRQSGSVRGAGADDLAAQIQAELARRAGKGR